MYSLDYYFSALCCFIHFVYMYGCTCGCSYLYYPQNAYITLDICIMFLLIAFAGLLRLLSAIHILGNEPILLLWVHIKAYLKQF